MSYEVVDLVDENQPNTHAVHPHLCRHDVAFGRTVL